MLNDNSKDVEGDYTFTIPCIGRRPIKGHTVSPAGSYGEDTIGPITCPEHGEYGYHVTFYFGPYNRTSGGRLVVVNRDNGGNDDSSGSLKIKDARFSPETPKDGDTVTFQVKVYNNYTDDKNVKLTLYIDGSEADSVAGSVSAGSTGEFSLHWGAEAGEHSYEVKLYSVDEKNGKEALEDSEDGSIEVSRVVNGLSAWFEVVPNPVEAGNNVTVYITVKNSENYKQTWPIELVGNTGNVWWPREDYYGMNYSISDGDLTIYANKTARITATIGPITQNTTLTLKIGGYQMASKYVEVNSNSQLIMSKASCEDIKFDFSDYAYRATVSCEVYLHNLRNQEVYIEHISVEDYSLGQLEKIPLGSLGVEKWLISPQEFTIKPWETRRIVFSLPIYVSSYIPISGSDATEVVLKNGEYTNIKFEYTLGYSIDRKVWHHYFNSVSQHVKITMDTKTVVADYVLSGIAAITDPNTAISISIGSVRILGLKVNGKLGLDPWAFLWNGLIKPYILEHT
ncbi:CARDB domain-containing protein [Thermococcus peptonophilus]|uniref:CARDB domain-containing protein n=1 Tax=Thermococcus peptonophilus TaxID=53952 RepID=UPI0018D382D0|nr:CARDB domain-containing protein [Thermococcus peptonophilus]